MGVDPLLRRRARQAWSSVRSCSFPGLLPQDQLTWGAPWSTLDEGHGTLKRANQGPRQLRPVNLGKEGIRSPPSCLRRRPGIPNSDLCPASYPHIRIHPPYRRTQSREAQAHRLDRRVPQSRLQPPHACTRPPHRCGPYRGFFIPRRPSAFSTLLFFFFFNPAACSARQRSRRPVLRASALDKSVAELTTR